LGRDEKNGGKEKDLDTMKRSGIKSEGFREDENDWDKMRRMGII